MTRSPKVRRCLNATCSKYGVKGAGNIRPHGFMQTKHGKRRRWICKACGTTLSTNTGTPYLRIHSSRTAFDRVAALRVEGVSISAIGRVTGHGWNTVARWLERAGVAAGKFNDAKLKGFELIELQLDELCTFVGGKIDVTWNFTAIEVSARLWPVVVAEN